jgi:hypothetical protein
MVSGTPHHGEVEVRESAAPAVETKSDESLALAHPVSPLHIEQEPRSVERRSPHPSPRAARHREPLEGRPLRDQRVERETVASVECDEHAADQGPNFFPRAHVARGHSRVGRGRHPEREGHRSEREKANHCGDDKHVLDAALALVPDLLVPAASNGAMPRLVRERVAADRARDRLQEAQVEDGPDLPGE